MPFETFTTPAVNTAVITALDDRPSLSAAQLKAAFDRVGVDLYAALGSVVDALNDHLADLAAAPAAAELGCAPVCAADDSAANLYAKIAWLKTYMDNLVIAAGAADMQKSVYDTDDDGVVDDAEKLGGQLPSAYAAAAHAHGGLTADGRLGTAADLPVFTATAGAVATKTAADARAALDARRNTAVVTDTSTTYTIATLADNTRYDLGTLTALTISAYPSGDYDSLICFTAGAGITVSLPATTWNGGTAPTFTAGKYYELSIRNGYGCYGEF